MLALTPDERNAVIHGIIRDLGAEQALALFERPQARRRLVDYAVVADELGFGGPLRATYPVEQALPALRRVLTEWPNTANDWRRLHAELDAVREQGHPAPRGTARAPGERPWCFKQSPSEADTWIDYEARPRRS